MMSLLNDDEGDTGLVRWLQFDTSFSYSPQFMGKDGLELAFRNSIARNM